MSFKDPLIEKLFDLIDANDGGAITSYYYGDPVYIPRSNLPALIGARSSTGFENVTLAEDQQRIDVVLTLITDSRDSFGDTAGIVANWQKLYEIIEGRDADYKLKSTSIMNILRTSGDLTDWGVRYEANELPNKASPAWEIVEAGTPFSEITNQTLHMTSSETDFRIYRRSNIGISNSTGFTCEYRLKVIACGTGVTGATMYLQGDTFRVWLYVSKGKVLLRRLAEGGLEDDSYEMDTTSNYHTYRLIVKDSTASAYIDGVLRLSGALGKSAYAAKIQFGDLETSVPDEYYWDYVRYRTDGAFEPGGDAIIDVAKPLVSDYRLVLGRRGEGSISTEAYILVPIYLSQARD